MNIPRTPALFSQGNGEEWICGRGEVVGGTGRSREKENCGQDVVYEKRIKDIISKKELC